VLVIGADEVVDEVDVVVDVLDEVEVVDVVVEVLDVVEVVDVVDVSGGSMPPPVTENSTPYSSEGYHPVLPPV